jgi:glycosyltransferase involved in cell wall biosynthesis
MQISVVVPVYNEEQFIRSCLEAVFRQQEPVHEVIVVDNGSADGTSARRIANRFRDYRTYVLMTERTYRRHPGRPRPHAYARAWLTARIQLLLFPSLRLAYALAQPHPLAALRRGGGRKNPMLPGR